MNQAELHTRLIPLMTAKQPLPYILSKLSDIPEDRVVDAYDSLIFEAYDIDLAYSAA